MLILIKMNGTDVYHSLTTMILMWTTKLKEYRLHSINIEFTKDIGSEELVLCYLMMMMTWWLMRCKYRIIVDRNLMLCFASDCLARLGIAYNWQKSNLNTA